MIIYKNTLSEIVEFCIRQSCEYNRETVSDEIIKEAVRNAERRVAKYGDRFKMTVFFDGSHCVFCHEKSPNVTSIDHFCHVVTIVKTKTGEWMTKSFGDSAAQDDLIRMEAVSLIESAGITRSKWASACGVTNATVSNWLTGRTPIPPLAMQWLRKVEKAING